MDLEKIYNKNKKDLFGWNSLYLEKLRNKLIKNFNFDNKILRNNESTKHIDIKIINEFEYNPQSANKFETIISEGLISKTSTEEKKNSFLEKIKHFENSFQDDYIVNLNTIFQNSGFIIDIDDSVENPIFIKNEISEDATIFAKNFFKIDNKNITIIEKFNAKKKSNANIINYFDIDKNSKVKHLIIQNNEINANLQFTNYINCFENSQYKQVIFNTSQSSIRNHSYANLLGSSSIVELKGVFFATNDQISDNKTVVNHMKPFCESNQICKGILDKNARASYLSKTFVDKIAQKTEAYQLSKGILLSENSHFHSKPELRIFADDVKCSHGSTIGPFDKNIIFYSRSRGLSERESISLLINSFYSDIVSNLENETYLVATDNCINQWLEKNSYI